MQRTDGLRLYASDLPELNCTDMRPMPLGERKAKLARLVDLAPWRADKIPGCYLVPAKDCCK